MMLVGNKTDTLSGEEAAEMTRKGEEYANRHGLLFAETSAKTGSNVKDSFAKLLSSTCLPRARTPAAVASRCVPFKHTSLAPFAADSLSLLCRDLPDPEEGRRRRRPRRRGRARRARRVRNHPDHTGKLCRARTGEEGRLLLNGRHRASAPN
jgi:hypothetical protein